MTGPLEARHFFAVILLVSLFVPVLAAQQRLVWATPGVTVTANPGRITFAVGSSATAQITITSARGFAGTLSLAAYSFPYQALNVAFNPSTVTLTAGARPLQPQRFQETARQLPTPTRLT